MLETLCLYLEMNPLKHKVLQDFSTALWSLIFHYLGIYYNKERFLILFDRIITKGLIYGNKLVYTRIILRLNFLNQIKTLIEEFSTPKNIR